MSVYAPSSVSASTSYAPLGAHYRVGYVLAVLSLLLGIVAALARRGGRTARAVVVLITIVLAGVFGRSIVTSAPNIRSTRSEWD